MGGSCEHHNGPSGSIKCRKVLKIAGQLSDSLKRGSAPWSQVKRADFNVFARCDCHLIFASWVDGYAGYTVVCACAWLV